MKNYTIDEQRYKDTELIFGLVSPVGVDYKKIISILTERLRVHQYQVEEIKVSLDVIKRLKNIEDCDSEYDRINKYMDAGNEIRKEAEDNSILAMGVAAKINESRDNDDKEGLKPREKVAIIVNSLKHPDEVYRLREIYTNGFYLIGIASDIDRRIEYLHEEKRMSQEDAEALVARDSNELEGHGQQTRDAFQLSDFFVHIDENDDRLKYSVWRILELIFGSPYLTPTFDEYAMFMAFASSLRSADLSRQVGAVIAKDNEIISTGANDCPKAGGGLYWPELSNNKIIDEQRGRDYTRGEDSNKKEQQAIIDDIIKNLDGIADKDAIESALHKSRIGDITEYGRVVHAEMEALLYCARNNISSRNATLYCTTFPCHNCAKHLIAAGIKKVMYIEPYPKSKAFEFHDDSIIHDEDDGSIKQDNKKCGKKKVNFVPFIGVGPRKFFDLFSMKFSVGSNLKRKANGKTIEWKPERSTARIQMLPFSYIEVETKSTMAFMEYQEKKGESHDDVSNNQTEGLE